MIAKDVLKLVNGSIVVYVVMAACSAASGQGKDGLSNFDGSLADGSGGSGSGGSGGGVGSSGPGGVMDALTDPVSIAAADPNQSGTRLKVRYYAGADGSKLSIGQVGGGLCGGVPTLAGMHDSMLNLDCVFAPMSDGALHCVPVFAGGTTAVVGSFADSSCTQQIALAPSGPMPPYAVSQVEAGCGYVYHVYPVTGAYAGTSYYEKTMVTTGTTKCTGPNPVTSLTLVTIGGELSPSTFVQASVQTEL